MRTIFTILALAVPAAAQAFGPLGPAPAPATNPTTPSKVLLGKMLFWEEQLSSDDAMACGTCHRPSAGGADARAPAVHPGFDGLFGTADDRLGSTGPVRQAANGDFVPAGVFGLRPQVSPRLAPSVIGAGHERLLNWDGSAGEQFVDPETGIVIVKRGAALENQALRPILDPAEMGHVGRTWRDVAGKLRRITPLRLARNLTPDITVALQQHGDYPALFAAAFGSNEITATRIAFALAAYQRSLNPDDTPWDRLAAGQPAALTPLEDIGWKLFRGKGRCTECHVPPLFADGRFHHVGLRPVAEDVGRGAFDPSPAAQGAFRTPSLRNAALRQNLFHNGQSELLGHPTQFWTYESTLNVHWLGSGLAPAVAGSALPDLERLGVTQNEVALMLEFVRTALVDERVRHRLPPFDHPDLRSMAEPPPRPYGPALAGGIEPFLVDWIPPYPGNAHFRLGLVGGRPGSIGTLVIGFQSYEPPLVVQGLPWNVNVHTWLHLPMLGAPGEPGRATWHVGLPDIPALATIPLYYQLFVDDPLAPGGIAASRGTEFFIR
jgi:cytochrome c peroxidase